MSDYEKNLNAEIEKRLKMIESRSYIFPQQFGKRDFVIVGLVAFLCLAVLVIGVFL